MVKSLPSYGQAIAKSLPSHDQAKAMAKTSYGQIQNLDGNGCHDLPGVGCSWQTCQQCQPILDVLINFVLVYTL